MKKRLGIGFVGAGFMTHFHIKAWRGVRHADICGVADPDSSRARAAVKACTGAQLGQPAAYDSAADLVADPAVDAIWICSPNDTRLAVMQEIADAVRSGRGQLIGVACEKPLARNAREARQMVDLIEDLGLLHGYLENQVFTPSLVRGREIVWRRGAAVAGRPYLARCAEEHGGPHEPWFWLGERQGGGVLNDMMCHSIEAARFLLTDPSKSRDTIRPVSVNAEIATLKWSRTEYVSLLKEMTQGAVDYARTPAEDFARANVTFEDQEGHQLIAEVTTSWSFVGPGLRLNFELMGPEYYMQVNTLDPELHVFFSRRVSGREGEDLVEKQTAEQGLMPVLAEEEIVYGYTEEDRHMVASFLNGVMPAETWKDGLLVTQLLMTAYKSSEQRRTLPFEPDAVADYMPTVAKGTYRTGTRT